jgi:hypothetical protein
LQELNAIDDRRASESAGNLGRKLAEAIMAARDIADPASTLESLLKDIRDRNVSADWRRAASRERLAE